MKNQVKYHRSVNAVALRLTRENIKVAIDWMRDRDQNVEPFGTDKGMDISGYPSPWVEWGQFIVAENRSGRFVIWDEEMFRNTYKKGWRETHE